MMADPNSVMRDAADSLMQLQAVNPEVWNVTRSLTSLHDALLRSAPAALSPKGPDSEEATAGRKRKLLLKRPLKRERSPCSIRVYSHPCAPLPFVTYQSRAIFVEAPLPIVQSCLLPSQSAVSEVCTSGRVQLLCRPLPSCGVDVSAVEWRHGQESLQLSSRTSPLWRYRPQSENRRHSCESIFLVLQPQHGSKPPSTPWQSAFVLCSCSTASQMPAADPNRGELAVNATSQSQMVTPPLAFGSDAYMSLVAKRTLLYVLHRLCPCSEAAVAARSMSTDIDISELRRQFPALTFISASVLQSCVIDRVAAWLDAMSDSIGEVSHPPAYELLPDGCLRIHPAVCVSAATVVCGASSLMTGAASMALMQCEWRVLQTCSFTNQVSHPMIWYLPQMPDALSTIQKQAGSKLASLLTPSMRQSLLRALLFTLYHFQSVFLPKLPSSNAAIALIPSVARLIAAVSAQEHGIESSPRQLVGIVMHFMFLLLPRGTGDFSHTPKLTPRQKRHVVDLLQKVANCVEGSPDALLRTPLQEENLEEVSQMVDRELRNSRDLQDALVMERTIAVAGTVKETTAVPMYSVVPTEEIVDLFDDAGGGFDSHLPQPHGNSTTQAETQKHPAAVLRRCKRTGAVELIHTSSKASSCTVSALWLAYQRGELRRPVETKSRSSQATMIGGTSRIDPIENPMELVTLLRTLEPSRGSNPMKSVISAPVTEKCSETTTVHAAADNVGQGEEEDDAQSLPDAPGEDEVARYMLKRLREQRTKDSDGGVDHATAHTVISVSNRAKQSRRQRWRTNVWLDIIRDACRDAGIGDSIANSITVDFTQRALADSSTTLVSWISDTCMSITTIAEPLLKQRGTTTASMLEKSLKAVCSRDPHASQLAGAYE